MPSLRSCIQANLNIEGGLDLKKELYIIRNKSIPLLEYFNSLALNESKTSVLNLSVEENKDNLSSNQKSICNATYYAKMITALHIDENSLTIENEEQEMFCVK